MLDLTNRALAGLSSADGTVVGGVVIAAVLAVLVRWVCWMGSGVRVGWGYV